MTFCAFIHESILLITHITTFTTSIIIMQGIYLYACITDNCRERVSKQKRLKGYFDFMRDGYTSQFAKRHPSPDKCLFYTNVLFFDKIKIYI